MRLTRALGYAWRNRAYRPITAACGGLAAVVATVTGIAANAPNVTGGGVLLAVGAILIARSARNSATANGETDLVYLSRCGRVAGWIVIGPLLGLAIVGIVIFGALLGVLNR